MFELVGTYQIFFITYSFFYLLCSNNIVNKIRVVYVKMFRMFLSNCKSNLWFLNFWFEYSHFNFQCSNSLCTVFSFIDKTIVILHNSFLCYNFVLDHFKSMSLKVLFMLFFIKLFINP